MKYWYNNKEYKDMFSLGNELGISFEELCENFAKDIIYKDAVCFYETISIQDCLYLYKYGCKNDIIYDRLYRFVESKANTVCKDKFLVPECVQKTIEILSKKYNNINDIGGFAYRICFFQNNNLNRKYNRQSNVEVELIDSAHNDKYNVFPSITTILQGLNSYRIEVVYRKVVLGQTFKQISVELNKNQKGVSHTYYESLKFLKKNNKKYVDLLS